MKDEAKRKEAKFNKNMARLICVAVMILTMGMMVGCGKGEESESDNIASETSEAIEEVEEENASEAVENAETLEPTETGETIEETEEQDTLAENDAPQNIEEWVATLDPEENKVTIWNENLREGTLLVEGQDYVIREGDLIVLLRGTNTFTVTDFLLPTTGGCPEYALLVFSEEMQGSREANITIDSDPSYSISFRAMTEEYAADNNVEVTEEPTNITETELSEGEQWVMSLNYEEPKLVFWNDELGTQTVVEEGESYQMSDGDVMAVYLPGEYYLSGAFVGANAFEPIFEEGYTLLECNFELSGTSMLEIFTSTLDNEGTYCTYTITTP